MSTSVISPELLDDELAALVRAGGYGSEREAMQHAISALLAGNAELRIGTAVELYRAGKVTLARAVELSGIEREAFKDTLHERGVVIYVETNPDEMAVEWVLVEQIRLKGMTSDPEILSQNRGINQEFASSEADGLYKL